MLHSDKQHLSRTLVHALCTLICTRYSPSYIRQHTHRPTSRDTNTRYSPPHPHVLHERDAPLGSDHLQVSAGERKPHVCVRILYECLCVCLCAWVCVRVCLCAWVCVRVVLTTVQRSRTCQLMSASVRRRRSCKCEARRLT